MLMIALAAAKRVIAAAELKASEIGVPQNIAVVDAGGNLVAFLHMDGAWLGSVDIAINKAFTARAFDLPTEDLGKMALPGKPFYGIQFSNLGRVQLLPGGIPLKAGDEIVGAVGVSGGTGEQDVQVAEAGVEALEG